MTNMSFFQSMEQLQMMLKDIAPVAASYHKELIKQGFTREEATQIVISWQQSMFGQQG